MSSPARRLGDVTGPDPWSTTMSTPDPSGAVGPLATAPTAPTPAPSPGLVAGAGVAGLGVVGLFALPAVTVGPRSPIALVVIAIALVVAGALVAARPGASRGAVAGLGAATLVVQVALRWTPHPAYLDVIVVLLLCVGLGLTWFTARRLLRFWWATALPTVVLAAGLVVNALEPREHDSNWYWRDWHTRPLHQLTLLLVGVALVLVVVLAERCGPDLSRPSSEEARAARYAANQAQSAAAAQAAQVAQIQQWQAAWAAANPGQPASAAPAPPMPVAMALPVAPGERTNTLAVLALVFGLLGSGIIPVVLGHISLGQIGRTGERGRGMAVGGLVLGYLELAVLAAVIISALSAL
jgi:hypothetical protein